MTAGDEARAGVAPPKNTGGGGFVFENDVCAWLLACLLAGEPPFDLRYGAPVRLDFQTGVDGWQLDDVLVTTTAGQVSHRCALSIKSNAQFTAAGAPSSFVEATWKQWLAGPPFDSIVDLLGIVTALVPGAARASITGLLEKATTGDPSLLPARLAIPNWASDNERGLFASFHCPAALAEAGNLSEADTVRLLKRVCWLEHDFCEHGSTSQTAAVAICRKAIRSGTLSDAETLWNELRTLANELRPRAGTIARAGLVERLRPKFRLAEYPDHAADWAKLETISTAAATHIPNAIAGRATLPRVEHVSLVAATLTRADSVALVGPSGGGKSAIARALFESRLIEGKRTIWFDGRSFEQPDLNAVEATLRLRHSLAELFKSSSVDSPLLFVDGLDRVYSETAFRNAAMLIRLCRPEASSANWRLIITSQTQEWPRILLELQRAGLSGCIWENLEVPAVPVEQLLSVGKAIPALEKLLLQPRVSRLLQNLKILDLVAQQVLNGAPVDSTTWVGESSVAEWFWAAEVDRGADRIPRGSFARRLAQAQADRLLAAVPADDFASSELATVDSLIADRICIQVADRLAFAHDLIGDWARLRVLLVHRDDLPNYLRSRIDSPLWHRAIRLLGMHMLERPNGVDEWRSLMTLVASENLEGVRDLLLEAPIFAANARPLLDSIKPDLLTGDGDLLRRLLTRFLAFATIPNPQTLDIARAMGIDENALRATSRVPYWPYWVDVLAFLDANGTEVVATAARQVARIVELWLSFAPDGSIMRPEAARVGVLLGKHGLELRSVYGGQGWQREKQRFFECALAAAKEAPDDVSDIALRAAQRQIDSNELATQDKGTRGERNAEGKAWPDGPLERVEDGFEEAVLGGNKVLSLFSVRPQLACEVILACLIEPMRDERRGYGWADRTELPLVHRHDWHPAFYTHGPFLACLRQNFESGLDLILRLVHFATERWHERQGRENAARRANAISGGHSTEEVEQALSVNCPLEVTIGVGDDARSFKGDSLVYGWITGLGTPRESIVSALMALEQYFYMQLEEEADIASEVAMVLQRSRSAALLKVLCHVGKRSPALFEGPLLPLLASHQLYHWDLTQAFHGRSHFMLGAADKGAWFAKLAQEFHELEHRDIDLRRFAIGLLLNRDHVRDYFQRVLGEWRATQNAHGEVAFPMLAQLIMSLDSANYEEQEHPEHGKVLVNVASQRAYEAQADERQVMDDHMLVTGFPMRCRKVLDEGEELSDEAISALWFQWARIRTLGKQPALPDGSERFGDEYANGITGGIAVFLRHLPWCEGDPSRLSELMSSLLGVLEDPPIRNGLDSSDAILPWSWDCFAAESAAILWARSPHDKRLREAVARLVMAPHYAAIALLFSHCAGLRETLGADFERLRRLALESAYIRPRIESLARIPPDGLGLKPGQIARLKKALNKKWDEQVAAFVAGSGGPIPENWADCDTPKIFAELDAVRARWSRHGALDFNVVQRAHQWLPLPSQARNPAERALWLQFWRSALSFTLVRPRGFQPRDQHKYPDMTEQWVLRAVAAVALDMTPTEDPQALWQPILDLTGELDDWADTFMQAVHKAALVTQDPPATYVPTVRAIVSYALTDRNGTRRWHSYESVWSTLIGVDAWSSRHWEARHEGVVEGLSDVFEHWMTMIPKDTRRMASFAHWLCGGAAAPMRLRTLPWFLGQVNANGRRRREDENALEDALAALLNVAWSEDEQRLRSAPPAFAAFKGLLAWLTDRQNVYGLELLGRMGSLG